ncbi:uncharacterized protein LOC135196937 [Macrobrachium nipponense]|uniref:uncharacterized protein LOC135196937 n=1 Tax=Macrobrachium nipponense TaxID=159736 RepID=UPI0030C888B2
MASAAQPHISMELERLQTLMALGTNAGYTGQELTQWVKRQTDDLLLQERAAREEERKKKEAERKHELALKEKELEVEKARQVNAEALAMQPAPSPTPTVSSNPIASINVLIPKWTEDEPEAWLEEVEALFENYPTTEIERAALLAKHLDGKAKTALRSLDQGQQGDLVEVRRVITKAYEITPERRRQCFRGQPRKLVGPGEITPTTKSKPGSGGLTPCRAPSSRTCLTGSCWKTSTSVYLGHLQCTLTTSNPRHLRKLVAWLTTGKLSTPLTAPPTDAWCHPVLSLDPHGQRTPTKDTHGLATFARKWVTSQQSAASRALQATNLLRTLLGHRMVPQPPLKTSQMPYGDQPSRGTPAEPVGLQGTTPLDIPGAPSTCLRPGTST